jgi:hypothetical protein
VWTPTHPIAPSRPNKKTHTEADFDKDHSPAARSAHSSLALSLRRLWRTLQAQVEQHRNTSALSLGALLCVRPRGLSSDREPHNKGSKA